MKLKTYIKTVSYRHLMPTRYSLDEDALKTVATADVKVCGLLPFPGYLGTYHNYYIYATCFYLLPLFCFIPHTYHCLRL